MRRRARLMPLVMTASILLKSWAMPPASWPIDSIFCICRTCCSAESRSAMEACRAALASASSAPTGVRW